MHALRAPAYHNEHDPSLSTFLCSAILFTGIICAAQAQQGVWERMTCVGCSGIDYSDVDFADQDTGYAIGGPLLVRTTDGGLTWTKSEPELPQSAGIAAVSFATGRIGYLGGTHVLKTTDAGQTWTTLYRVTVDGSEQLYFTAMKFHGENFGVGVSPTLKYHVTRNGGVTWSVKNAMCTPCTCLEIPSTGVAYFGGWMNWVGGVSGVLALGTDSLTRIDLYNRFTSPGSQFQIRSLAVRHPLRVWAAGARFSATHFSRNIIFTHDSGYTWHEPETVLPYPINAIAFADDMHGFAGDEEGDIYRTSDGGYTWILDHKGHPMTAIRDIVVRGSTIIAVCNGSTILRRTVPVSVQDRPNQMGFRLHPNPSIGSVHVKFDDSWDPGERTKLSLHDAIGNTVFETFATRSTTLDLSSVSPGMYRVVARSGDRVASHNLLVVR
jgi:photosystem II stability/assembly factor-like uncharacterized protein